MKLTEFFLNELEREVDRSRRALEQVPDGKYDWKPHEKSMIFGYLADMVATMPSWLAMMITRDELDVAPSEGSQMPRSKHETSEALVKALDKSASDARAALEKADDDFLKTSWLLLARGKVVAENPRAVFIQDTFNHWAHHRGQMTVYLRLMGAKVPALFGPSADDNSFE
jgi:uncharacterized damage-inducible protein DinB